MKGSRLEIAIMFRSRIFYYFSLTFHEQPLEQEGAREPLHFKRKLMIEHAKYRGRCKCRNNGSRKIVIASTLSFICYFFLSRDVKSYLSKWYFFIFILTILYYTEKICRLKSHRLCIILVDRLESRLNIMSLLIEEYDR